MSLTQFAMVEELAFLIKDNVHCKQLVLSLEEMLVNFIENCMSSDGVLELEPMNSYSRLLIHRLADIFGFAHQSVGEGENRHLILEYCPETSIPSILVSDLLCQSDEYQSSRVRHLQSSMTEDARGSTFVFKEGQQAYITARPHDFLMDDFTRGPIKQKPRSDPQVAHRMIVHALGHKKKTLDQMERLKVWEEDKDKYDMMIATDRNDQDNFRFGKCRAMDVLSSEGENENRDQKVRKTGALSSQIKRLTLQQPTKTSFTNADRKEVNVQHDKLKENHTGAAKRIFAHALGFSPRRGAHRSGEDKQQPAS